jgi:hypothetical protein
MKKIVLLACIVFATIGTTDGSCAACRTDYEESG